MAETHSPMYWGSVSWSAPTYTLTVNVTRTIPIQQVNTPPPPTQAITHTLSPPLTYTPSYTPSYSPAHTHTCRSYTHIHTLLYALLHNLLHPIPPYHHPLTPPQSPLPSSHLMPQQNVTLMVNGSDITLSHLTYHTPYPHPHIHLIPPPIPPSHPSSTPPYHTLSPLLNPPSTPPPLLSSDATTERDVDGQRQRHYPTRRRLPSRLRR